MLLLLACRAPDPVEACPGTWADADGDGYGGEAGCAVAVGGDCDDADPDVHPGAGEACGSDADCDGLTDEDGASGCVDGWTDADGDGLGAGDPVCACVATGVAVGGDCDDTDVDRQSDCSEGEARTLDGVRIAADDGRYWSLLGEAEGRLVLVSTEDTVAVVTIPAESAAQSTVTETTLPSPTWTRPVLGDLDGDGLTDLFVPNGIIDGASLTPTPSLIWGLQEGETQTLTLDPLSSPAAYESRFVADLDGDDVPEGWYALGTGEEPGDAAVWRIVAGEAEELARLEEAVATWTLLAPLGDLDGDGVAELGTYEAGEGGTTLTVEHGPIDTPGHADVALTVPALRDVVGIGDLDGDGRGELALVGEKVWILAGDLESGDAEALGVARIGSESDVADDSALFVATGGGALVVTDTFWPARTGAGNLRGAAYRFDGPVSGVLDVRSADVRVYGEEYAALGAFPARLADGRLAVGAPVETTEVGIGAVWVLGW